MQSKKLFILLLTALAVGITAAGCTPQGPCEFTGTTDLTVYRLPDLSSDIFGTLPAGETHEVLARTAGGWIGFDPGVAQAGNTGLAHHRWIKLNATLSPICLSSVDEVTLVEVMAALPPTPPPPTTVPEDETADMEITNVVLSTNTVPVNDRVDVAVTVTNQGSLTATGYDIVLIPHYGWGPPNPGGYQAVPDLAPGASHTVAISPGVLYGNLGSFTLRVLLTDDWYVLGDPDSTGTAGDYEDFPITVTTNVCNPFEDLKVSLMTLNIRADTGKLPVYIKVEGGDGIFPGTDPELMDGLPLYEYEAKFGKTASYRCGLQGFPDRLYCMFDIPEVMEGTAQFFELWLNDCPDPVYTQANVLIPVTLAGDDPSPSGPTCTADLKEADCKAAGGSYQQVGRTSSNYECVCP